MNCGLIKKKIVLAFSGSLFQPDDVVNFHIESCADCRAYYLETVRLRDGLNGQPFRVEPGELDDISFEKITSVAADKKRLPDKVDSRFSLIARWVWIPASAAALILLAVFLPGFLRVSETGDTDNGAEWLSYYEILSIEGIQEEVIAALAGSETQIDNMTDELSGCLRPYELLNVLNDDELTALDKAIDKIYGSAG